MSTMKQKDYQTRWIPIRQLSVVWADAQRPPNPREEQRIADEFDPDALDPLTVTLQNGNGLYHIIDGQTRRGAVLRLWGDEDQKMLCRVLNTKSCEEAARIWLTMNRGHKAPNAVETFLVSVTAGRPDYVAVNGIVGDLGYRIAKGGGDDGTISAVHALMLTYRSQGDVGLVWTLGVIRETWGMSRDAVNGSIVQGYARLLAKHNGLIDRARLVEKVSKQFTPGRFIGTVRNHRDLLRGTMPTNAVRVLEETYNHNLRTGARLEP